jgi:hypothetical protein
MTAPAAAGERHRHCTTVDDEGNGKTTPGPDGHVHQVVELEVMAGGQDGHTHGMSAQRCSAPHINGRCTR